jgi:hypothetical protein
MLLIEDDINWIKTKIESIVKEKLSRYICEYVFVYVFHYRVVSSLYLCIVFCTIKSKSVIILASTCMYVSILGSTCMSIYYYNSVTNI